MRTHPSLLVTLGLLTAIGPLSTTMYAPAMPAMGADLDAGASAVGLTVSALTIGLAVGMVVVGPLSDRLGRRAPLVGGLAIYVLASLACAAAPSPAVLIAARLLQGIAGAAGIVVGRAVVRDLRSGTAAAQLFALLMLITGTTPVLAPLLGGLVLDLGSWRAIFLTQAVAGALLTTAAALVVGETLPPERRQRRPPLRVAASAVGLLRDRQLLACALVCGLVYGGILTCIAGSGFVFQNVYGTSARAGAIALAAGAAGLIACSQLARRAVRHHGPARVLAGGVALSLTAGVLALLAVATGAGLWLLVPALFASFGSHGVTLPNATALALEDFPHAAGSASAALGLVQYAVGAAVAPLAGVAGEHTAWPLAITITAAAVGAAALLRWTRPSRPTPRTPRLS